MHLDEVASTTPIYADVDKDGDGKVDGTNIPFDGTSNPGGVYASGSNKNLNPIVPPEYFKIKNFGGYTIVFGNESTTFLDGTYIEVDGTVINDPED